jgi:hypothetical protein
MPQAPYRWTIDELTSHVTEARVSTSINGRWVPARPWGLDTLPSRVRLAWEVFTGRADALVWPGQNDT